VVNARYESTGPLSTCLGAKDSLAISKGPGRRGKIPGRAPWQNLQWPARVKQVVLVLARPSGKAWKTGKEKI